MGLGTLFYICSVVIGKPEPHGMCTKLRTVAASNNRDHVPRSLYYCLFTPHTYDVVLCTHSVQGELCISVQRQQSGCNNIPFFLQQTAPITFFLWRFHIAWPSHPGHSTILLRSESPSGMCTKVRTVAASNIRDHVPWLLYYCLFAPHTCGGVLRTHSIRGEPCISAQH